MFNIAEKKKIRSSLVKWARKEFIMRGFRPFNRPPRRLGGRNPMPAVWGVGEVKLLWTHFF